MQTPSVRDIPPLTGTDPRQIEEYAARLLAFYGLSGWTFGWDGARRRCGLCDHRRRRISLSRHFAAANPAEAVEGTLRHELAHALCGPGHGHGRTRKAKAVEVGARPERCCQADMPAATRWLATCLGCGLEFRRFRRPRRLTRWHCRQCGPARGRLEWKLNGRGEVRDAS